MDFVVKDLGGDWFFDGNKTYVCKNASDKVVGKIYAEYLPDPVSLWQSKCTAAGVVLNSEEAKTYKPSNVVFKLWEHKNANSNQ